MTPTLDEARLDAIKNIIVSNIGLINAALAIDGATPIVLSGANVHIGDPITLPDISDGPAWICVSPDEGGDITTEIATHVPVDIASGRKITLNTTISVYIHDRAFGAGGSFAQVEARERARSRISDTIRYSIIDAHYTLATASQQYNTPGGLTFDTIQLHHVTEVVKLIEWKAFGEMIGVLCARLRLSGFIQA